MILSKQILHIIFLVFFITYWHNKNKLSSGSIWCPPSLFSRRDTDKMADKCSVTEISLLPWLIHLPEVTFAQKLKEVSFPFKFGMNVDGFGWQLNLHIRLVTEISLLVMTKHWTTSTAIKPQHIINSFHFNYEIKEMIPQPRQRQRWFSDKVFTWACSLRCYTICLIAKNDLEALVTNPLGHNNPDQHCSDNHKR